MKCKYDIEFIQSYNDNCLCKEEKSEFERHMRNCSKCSTAFAKDKIMLSYFKKTPDEPLNNLHKQKLMNSIPSGRYSGNPKKYSFLYSINRFYPRLRFALLAAAVIIIIATILFNLSHVYNIYNTGASFFNKDTDDYYNGNNAVEDLIFDNTSTVTPLATLKPEEKDDISNEYSKDDNYLSDEELIMNIHSFFYEGEEYLIDYDFGIKKLTQSGDVEWHSLRVESYYESGYDYGYCNIFFCDGEWLYYTKVYSGGGSGEGPFDPNYGMFGKVKIDGSERIEYPGIEMLYPVFYDDWIYYRPNLFIPPLPLVPTYIHKVKRDGSSVTQVVSSKKCQYFFLKDGELYYWHTEYGARHVNQAEFIDMVSSFDINTGEEKFGFISIDQLYEVNEFKDIIEKTVRYLNELQTH
ncbi:UNVERIFIED_CONTAM: hypothetical protein Cloal_0918 [Acetivibrio alkalicellulosi]